jgi:uncharacterized protein
MCMARDRPAIPACAGQRCVANTTTEIFVKTTGIRMSVLGNVDVPAGLHAVGFDRRDAMRRISLAGQPRRAMKRTLLHAAKVLCVWSSMTWALGAGAAGLDCAAANSSVEKLICANPALSARDATLNRVYGWALADAAPVDRTGIVAAQKQWIARTRDACSAAGCVGDAYDVRIRELAAIRFDGGAASYVTDPAVVARMTRQIQQDLRKVGMTQALGTCSRMLSLDSHRDSYGALCNLGNQKPVQICDENMVGNLAVSFYGFVESGPGLAAFTRAACPGG